MAKFSAELPVELIKEIEKLAESAPKMMQEMTHAAAVVTRNNAESNIDSAFSGDTSILKNNLKIADYKSPSDDGVNTKVFFSGYANNATGQKVPVPLVAMAREYGTSSGEAKKPFFRRAFKKAQIVAAMEKVQKRVLPHE